jgi:hypothetical protein
VPVDVAVLVVPLTAPVTPDVVALAAPAPLVVVVVPVLGTAVVVPPVEVPSVPTPPTLTVAPAVAVVVPPPLVAVPDTHAVTPDPPVEQPVDAVEVEPLPDEPPPEPVLAVLPEPLPLPAPLEPLPPGPVTPVVVAGIHAPGPAAGSVGAVPERTAVVPASLESTRFSAEAAPPHAIAASHTPNAAFTSRRCVTGFSSVLVQHGQSVLD